MKKPLPLTDKDGEVRELTAEDFKNFKPAIEVLPASLLKKLASSNESQQTHRVYATVQFERDVLESLKAIGSDWQVLMNDALKNWLKEHANDLR